MVGRNWDEADVRVHDTTWVIPQTPFETLYPGWQKSTVGGYWIGGSVMMPEKYQGGLGNSGSIGDVSWGRTLGHELGHYVFWLGDEYEDWKHNTYLWGYMTCDDFACYPNWELYNMAPHSVMKHEWNWSELSTPRDYERFHEYLNKTENFGD